MILLWTSSDVWTLGPGDLSALEVRRRGPALWGLDK